MLLAFYVKHAILDLTNNVCHLGKYMAYRFWQQSVSFGESQIDLASPIFARFWQNFSSFIKLHGDCFVNCSFLKVNVQLD